MAALLAVEIPSFGQVQRIHADIRGGGGDGKCTFEVDVDGAAEVEIRGGEGYLRTVRGAPARWIRLDCNQPLPAQAGNFRFRGIDGRGRQSLLRDPNRNGGVAVILIEDRDNGREKYTGDIQWRGGYDAGYDSDPRSRDYDPRSRDYDPRSRDNDRRRGISKQEAVDICSAEIGSQWRVERRRINLEAMAEGRDGSINLRFDFAVSSRELRRGVCSVAPSGQILNLRLDGERDRYR